MPTYHVKRTNEFKALTADWDAAFWKKAETADISNFLPKSSEHRPKVQARLLVDAEALYGIYAVDDRYVRCVHDQFQSSVCKDSCVEFFVRPKADGNYFNFEFSGGGTLLCYYIPVDADGKGILAKRQELTPEEGEMVTVRSTLPKVVAEEIVEPISWRLAFRVPFALLARYAGPLKADDAWTCNFYKCGDETSHPHWAAWSPVDAFNFHLPRCFGRAVFEGGSPVCAG